jgi:SAM-dependent methyltransferase
MNGKPGNHLSAKTHSGPSYTPRAGPAGWLDRFLAFFALSENQEPHRLRSLLLVSFASLYLEVVLIRWISTEVGVFAFFQNLALIACFLGFGLGCYRASRKKRFLFDFYALAALILIVELPLAPWQRFLASISNSLALSPDAALWGFTWRDMGHQGALLVFGLSLAAVTVFLILIVATMIPLGQWVGFYLDRAPNPVTAYSVNLLGSLAGIWVFAAAAFLWLPPIVWFGLAILLLLLLRPRSSRIAITSVALIVASLVVLRIGGSGGLLTIWSPYQKLQAQRINDLGYNIHVNNTTYMTIADLSPKILVAHPEWAHTYSKDSSYDAPFRFANTCRRVLIVGAGAGNDAAAALRHCSGHIDAVEIDPAIYSLGKRLHPQHPYLSPRVRVILNDARAFMRNAHGKYDVILFGLLDSHTDFSGFSNMRIDNYVYTEQSFQEARQLLAPDGVLVVKFEVRAPWTWMGQRFYRTLTSVFGHAPIVFYARDVGALLPGTVFLESNGPGLRKRAAEPQLAALIRNNPPPFSLHSSDPPSMATDNWPYVYHRSHTIPTTYFSVALILFLLSVLLVRSSFQARRRSTWLFFFLGAGFMLLETQLVSRLALYFGSTWLVNCIALSAILLVLVAANVYVQRFAPRRLGIYFIVLVASLLANYLFPWDTLSFSAHTVGILLSAAYAVSLFPAGVIFTEMFRRSEGRSVAFAANIVGAVAGGLMQNLSFIFGIRDLLLLAAAFYAVAFLAATRPSEAEVLAPIEDTTSVA